MTFVMSSFCCSIFSRHVPVTQVSIRWTGKTWARSRMKHYVFQELEAKDCQQKFIRGWGPGGSKVNTAVNAVQLRHVPSNCTVKVHDSRSLEENIRIARQRLKFVVDRHLNGENCYEEQLQRLEKEYSIKSSRRYEKRRELKRNIVIEGIKDKEQTPDIV